MLSLRDTVATLSLTFVVKLLLKNTVFATPRTDELPPNTSFSPVTAELILPVN